MPLRENALVKSTMAKRLWGLVLLVDNSPLSSSESSAPPVLITVGSCWSRRKARDDISAEIRI